MKQQSTTELKRGDIVVFADLRDVVLSVELPTPPAVIARVKTLRISRCHGTPVPDWFLCGTAALHDVEDEPYTGELP